jgi:hypothetical protein
VRSRASHAACPTWAPRWAAIAGTILVSVVANENRAYAVAMAALAVIGLIGLGAAWLLPAKLEQQES